MVRLTVRYLSARARKSGVAYYWIPTPALIAAGFAIRRLPDNRVEAIARAEQLNAELDAWREQGTAPAAIRAGTVAAIDLEFQADDDFRRLAPRTQDDYLRCIQPALAWCGDQPIQALTRRAVKAWYRMQRETRGQANSRNAMAALRRLLSYAVSESHIADNPAMHIKITAPSERHRVWTVAERDAFIAAAHAHQRPSMAAAVMLGWCLGQRPADLRTLSWGAVDGSTVAIRQAKTGALVRVPMLPELRALLADLPRVSTQIVVSETTQRPYQESAFQHLFAEIRQRAGLPADLQFRDLRRTMATALGAAGCSEQQIRAITGHRSGQMLKIYVRPDDATAEAAMARLRTDAGRSQTPRQK